MEMLMIDADPDQLLPRPGGTGFPVSGDDHGALEPESPFLRFIPIGLIAESQADQPGMSARADELMTERRRVFRLPSGGVCPCDLVDESPPARRDVPGCRR